MVFCAVVHGEVVVSQRLNVDSYFLEEVKRGLSRDQDAEINGGHMNGVLDRYLH